MLLIPWTKKEEKPIDESIIFWASYLVPRIQRQRDNAHSKKTNLRVS